MTEVIAAGFLIGLFCSRYARFLYSGRSTIGKNNPQLMFQVRFHPQFGPIFWVIVALYTVGCTQRQASPRTTLLPEPPVKKGAAVRPVASDSLLMTYVKQWLEARNGHWEGVVEESARRLYEQKSFFPIWLSGNGLKPLAEEALQLIASSEAYGLEKEMYAWEKLRSLLLQFHPHPPDPLPYAALAQFDVSLTRAILQFSRHLHQGKIRLLPPKTADSQTFSVLSRVQMALKSDHSVPGTFTEAILSCQPDNRKYRLLQQSLARWVKSPVLADSLARRQKNFRQLAGNLERWRSDSIPDSEYILINIPAFQLQVVRKGQVVATHRVIVGKPSSPTPILSSQIRYFTASPEWHVLASIAVKEMLPQIRRNPGYLAKNNLQLYDRHNNPVDASQVDWSTVTANNFAYVIRQSSGCDNALGHIVFRFDNPYSVYLHDTPNRTLFTKLVRAFSHGCIRLENPLLLAQLLLAREGDTTSIEMVRKSIAQESKRHFRLKRPMPIHVRYATVSSEGEALAFHRDLYRLDEPLLKAFELYSKARIE